MKTRITTTLSRSNGAVRVQDLLSDLAPDRTSFNFTILYGDSQARSWARELGARVGEACRSKTVRGTWWKLDDLAQPAVLAGAVSQALHADLIVLAWSGAEGLPLSFYYWANAWLPHRRRGLGALVALLGAHDPLTPHSGRVRKYLRALAHRGGLRLLLTERRLRPLIC